MLLKTQESCCAAIKFAVAFASLSDPRAVFSAGDGHADRAGPLSWDKHLVLPGGGAEPPVRLLSLTPFLLVTSYLVRACPRRMAAPPVAFVCYVIAFRVPSCPRAHLLSSAPRLAPLIPAGPSVSKELRRYRTCHDQVNARVGPFCLHLRPA